MITLSLRLLKFWTVDAFRLFIRLWKNTISLVEEDLGVELMTRLLFVPLFHDFSITGRILSFVFRVFRICIGLFAYLLVSILILMLALNWYLWPVFLLSTSLKLVGLATAVFGLLLFIGEAIFSPAKKVRDLKSPTEIWQATKLKSTVNWPQLLNSYEVKDLLFRLELEPEIFTNFPYALSNQLMEKSYLLAKDLNADYISPAYLFIGNLLLDLNLDKFLIPYQLKSADFFSALNFIELRQQKLQPTFLWSEDFKVKHLKGTNRGWLGAPTPALDRVSNDLTRLARYSDVDEFIGRQAQIARLIQILSSQKDKNALIVGPAGSGKTSLAKYLARLILNGDAPASLATKRLVELDLTKLLGGVQAAGDLASHVDNFFKEVQYFQNTIIFVDEVQNLSLGAAGQLNLLSLIEPHLESGQFQFLATTEERAYNQIIETNSVFSRVFQRVDLPPATPEETLEYLKSRIIDIEQKGQIKFSLIALKELISLSTRLIHDRVLPDSALSIFQDCLESNQSLITSKTVQELISQKVQIPIQQTGGAQKEQLLNLEDQIHQKLIDQVEAVKAVASSLRRAAVQLREQSRPIGSFLFVGPTGVGKTELAKTLSQVYFKDKGNFIRLDMSEYQTSESVDRLIGSPTMPGILTEEIEHKPYSLLLLDEFEKANPNVLNLFLQIFDDGRLSDYSGKTVDFTNTIIIATSNVASLIIIHGLDSGQSIEQLKPQVGEELLKTFKPELVNRFDDIIIFKPLSSEDLQKVVKIKLADLQKNLLSQGYDVAFSAEVISELAARGYDPALGARPLRRLIQDTLEARLSTMILEDKLPKGETFTITLDQLA